MNIQNKFTRLFILLLISSVSVTNYSQTLPNELFLKDYRPESIYNVPINKPKKSKFPIVDVHSHPYAKTDVEINQWVKTMDEAGIEKTIILTHAYGSKFDSIYAMFSNYRDRFELWCGIDYTGHDHPDFGEKAVTELERCYKKGARGVSELGDKG